MQLCLENGLSATLNNLIDLLSSKKSKIYDIKPIYRNLIQYDEIFLKTKGTK